MAYYPHAIEIGGRYQLVASDGTTAIFNDPTDPNFVGMLTEVTGLDSADVRESAQELVEADGGTHGSFYFGRRPITMSGLVFNFATTAARNARLDLGRRASNALRADAQLSWTPSNRSVNFVLNPNLEPTTLLSTTNSLGYITGTATLTRSTAQFQAGVASVQVATTNSANGIGFTVEPNSVRQGVSYTASFYARGNAGGETIDFFEANNMAGNFYGNSLNVVASATLTTSFQRFSFTFTPLETHPLPVIAVRQVGATARNFFVDSVMIAPTSQSTTYVDGTMAGYYNNGDPGTSSSANYIEMMTPVRRNQPWRESGGWNKTFQLALVSEYATLFSSNLHSATGSGVSVENRGNWPAYPLVTITGASTNPTVTINGVVFRTTGLTLAGGEAVQFDLLNHTGTFTVGARAGQAANRYIDFATTAWPSINTGTQTVTLAGGGTLTTVSWRDTWA